MKHEGSSSSLLSSVGVGLAIVGAALPETLLQVAGPLIALAVHVWTERVKRDRVDDKDAEIAALRAEIQVLRLMLPRPTPMPPVEPLRVVGENL